MYVPMIDAGMELQAEVTKTASFNSDWFHLGKGYTPGGLGELLAAVVAVSALDLSSTNETYSFKLQEADADDDGAVDAGSARDIGVAVSATAVGTVVARGIVTAPYIRLVLTAAGTTPSITYEAHVGK